LRNGILEGRVGAIRAFINVERTLVLISYLNVQHSAGPVRHLGDLDCPPTRFVVLAVPRDDRRPVNRNCFWEDCDFAAALPAAGKFHLRPVGHIHGEIFVVTDRCTADAASREGVRSTFWITSLVFN